MDYHYVRDGSGDEVEVIRVGFAWLEQRAKDDNADRAVLMLREKLDLGPGKSLRRALGDRPAQAMRRNQPSSLGDVPLQVITARDIGKTLDKRTRAPVLCVYCDDDEIALLDEFSALTAICVAPVADYNQGWIAEHGAEPIDYEIDR